MYIMHISELNGRRTVHKSAPSKSSKHTNTVPMFLLMKEPDVCSAVFVTYVVPWHREIYVELWSYPL